MVYKAPEPQTSGLIGEQFLDRNQAGRRLAEVLLAFKDKRPLVLALPRGGLPIGYEVAKALAAPLDLVFVRKIGAPYQPELALGAVADGGRPITIRNDDVIRMLGVSESYLQEEIRRKLAEIDRRRTLYLAGRPRVDVKGRTAIVVDDGIATGATVRAALRSVRKGRPARLVLAVPVAPPETIEVLKDDADEVICLETPVQFFAISMFYRRFEQVSDQEVVDWLKRAEAFLQSEETEGESAAQTDRPETNSAPQ
ncbi:MAG: phosphoribosyltransferase [Kiloniellales bacterium]|nr:phosphoribosyltransferase [Kiloniellales bacterium]